MCHGNILDDHEGWNSNVSDGMDRNRDFRKLRGVISAMRFWKEKLHGGRFGGHSFDNAWPPKLLRACVDEGVSTGGRT